MLNAVLVSDPDFASQIIQVFHGNFNLSAYVLNSKANAFRLETEKKTSRHCRTLPPLIRGVPTYFQTSNAGACCWMWIIESNETRKMGIDRDLA